MVRVFLYLDLVTLLMSMHGIHIADTLMEWALKVNMLIKFRNHHVWIICLVIFLLTFFFIELCLGQNLFQRTIQMLKMIGMGFGGTVHLPSIQAYHQTHFSFIFTSYLVWLWILKNITYGDHLLKVDNLSLHALIFLMPLFSNCIYIFKTSNGLPLQQYGNISSRQCNLASHQYTLMECLPMANTCKLKFII